MAKIDFYKSKFKPIKKKKTSSSYILPKTKDVLKKDTKSYILIVDDDETLLKFFKIHLTNIFSKVIVASNAIDAAKVLKTKKIDLVLSDIKMPQVSGIELLDNIKSTDPSIPVYLISGIMLDEKTLNYIKQNADGFLPKPFSVDEIHNFIKQGLYKRKIFIELQNILSDKEIFIDYIKNPNKVVEQLKSQKQYDEKTKKIIFLLEKLQKLNASKP